jgi:outer membrane protein assembly factor BamD
MPFMSKPLSRPIGARGPAALILSACLCVLLWGCASNNVDHTAGWSPQKLYAEARDEMNSNNWEKAAPLLEKLEGRAAGTPLAQQAQLDRAWVKYKSAETGEALAILERFMKLHPASPALDYAMYLKGVITFNDDLGFFSSLTRQDLSERDQKASKDSFEAFRELVVRFPDSKYSPDARLRMTYIINSLAQYEVHVAKYYYKRGAYLAAINRAQAAIADYRAAPALEDAVWVIYQSYDALGLADLRDDARRVLQKNYPDSVLLQNNGERPGERPWWKLW